MRGLGEHEAGPDGNRRGVALGMGPHSHIFGLRALSFGSTQRKNNESAQPIGVYDSNTGQISDNDPHVKTSISNSGFVGTDEIQWAAVINYANGNNNLNEKNN